ncbi:MAG TPA: hypothetical protein VMW82_02695 [Candidatus Paceibacterota bacterium]|nr:hypothetical protein [Candidatus Paceibacterota bacterium]
MGNITEKFQKILSEIKASKGDVVLFAIMKIDELTDKWTVILCASWATEANRGEIFKFTKGLLDGHLDSEERKSIARIGIFRKEDHIIQALLDFKSETKISEDTQINGSLVHEAYIFASNREDKVVEEEKE